MDEGVSKNADKEFILAKKFCVSFDKNHEMCWQCLIIDCLFSLIELISIGIKREKRIRNGWLDITVNLFDLISLNIISTS